MNSLSILVVDDDPVIRRLLEERLKKAKYTVEVAEDGYVAEKLLQQQHFDVVLTDLMMPGDIGGIEVLEIAKSISQDIEVVLITAHSSVGTAVDAMKKGAVDYLEKPINFDELFLRIEKIINVKSIINNARDIQQAMDVTENAASKTIQDLEIYVADLQKKLDAAENVLRSRTLNADDKVQSILTIITGV